MHVGFFRKRTRAGVQFSKILQAQKIANYHIIIKNSKWVCKIKYKSLLKKDLSFDALKFTRGLKLFTKYLRKCLLAKQNTYKSRKQPHNFPVLQNVHLIKNS